MSFHVSEEKSEHCGYWEMRPLSPIGRETSLEFLVIQSKSSLSHVFYISVGSVVERKRYTHTGKYLCRFCKYDKSYILCKLTLITIKQKDKNSLIGSGQIFLFY